VKILNWLGRMWGGRLRFTTALLSPVGLVSMFTVGGLSGVTHSIAPADTQQTDTYYIVAHFHYVIFGGSIFGVFAGFYFWWPKVFGHQLNERIGKWNFWTMLVGFNVTFGPMHILGLQGMSRRIDTYDSGYGFAFWNLVATIGAFMIAVGILVFIWNIWYSARKWFKAGKPDVGPDPWDGRSLEWMTASPTPEHNFDTDIEVEGLDEFWHRKYGYDENHKVVRIAEAEEVAHDGSATDVHLPSPSYYPIVFSAGMPLVGYGVIFSLWLCIPGAALMLWAMVGWIFEHPDDPNAVHGHGDHHDDEPDALEAGDETAGELEAADATEEVPSG